MPKMKSNSGAAKTFQTKRGRRLQTWAVTSAPHPYQEEQQAQASTWRNT